MKPKGRRKREKKTHTVLKFHSIFPITWRKTQQKHRKMGKRLKPKLNVWFAFESQGEKDVLLPLRISGESEVNGPRLPRGRLGSNTSVSREKPAFYLHFWRAESSQSAVDTPEQPHVTQVPVKKTGPRLSGWHSLRFDAQSPQQKALHPLLKKENCFCRWFDFMSQEEISLNGERQRCEQH